MKEVTITDHIAKMYGFKTQVKCKAGSVDLMSDTSIIECKTEARRWKEAVGQVSSYGMHYPDKQKEIWFFCARSLKVEQQIKDLGIDCVWFTGGMYGKQSCPLPPQKKTPKFTPKPILSRRTSSCKRVLDECWFP